MTALKDRLAAAIAANGPMSVADYMAACLFDPQFGYYTTREPFGTDGDFVTAPEVSQMFGEILAATIVGEWAERQPVLPLLAEIGPGRGTLMRDMLRTIGRLAPRLAATMRVAMVEASPRLCDIQKAALAGAHPVITWHQSIDALPDGPIFVVANELFDAVPARQFVNTQAGWRERVVGLDEDGQLAFFAGAAGIDPDMLPANAADAPTGAIFEVSPAREAMMDGIAARIAASSGFGIFIDYGHAEAAVGDTLQAMSRHAPADILAAPGTADLTTHVDFAALAGVARRYGLHVGLVTQAEFLLSRGLLERAGALGADAGKAARERLRRDVERLAGDNQMGRLFKVMTVASPAGTVAAD